MRSKPKTTSASVRRCYAKGHLKRYAALLGLPADEIMAGYESRVHAPKPAVAQPANVRLRTDAPAVSNLPWPQVAGSVAAILLVLGVLWWRPWHQRGAAPVQSQPLAVNSNATGAVGAADSAGADLASAADSSSATSDRVTAVRAACDAAAGRSRGEPAGARRRGRAQCDGGDGPGTPSLELFRGLVGGCP